jgi:hypothetical protein
MEHKKIEWILYGNQCWRSSLSHNPIVLLQGLMGSKRTLVSKNLKSMNYFLSEHLSADIGIQPFV